MPSVQKIHEKYAGKDVAVFGVNTWERKQELAPKYMKDNKYTYGCLLKGDDLAKSYGISGIPTMILIDKEGKVLKTLVGFDEGELDELSKMIDEALAKK
jgi:thioredoxin-related protein